MTSKDPQREQSDQEGVGTITRESVETKKPPMYKVVMLNDDFTPMEFVVHVLMKFFRKSEAEAVRLMLQVHNDGCSIVGVYTYEIAETKTQQVNEYSRQHEVPLLCKFEKE